jgi:hypothetical protein
MCRTERFTFSRATKAGRVEVDDEERARSVHTTQAEAIASAREIAQRSERELCIHGRDGRIRDRLYRGAASRGISGLPRRALRPAWRAWGLAALVLIVAGLALVWIVRERSDRLV